CRMRTIFAAPIAAAAISIFARNSQWVSSMRFPRFPRWRQASTDLAETFSARFCATGGCPVRPQRRAAAHFRAWRIRTTGHRVTWADWFLNTETAWAQAAWILRLELWTVGLTPRTSPHPSIQLASATVDATRWLVLVWRRWTSI